MSWKRFFRPADLAHIISKRKLMFVIDESLSALTRNISDKKEWNKNRKIRQGELLALVKANPSYLNYTYKLFNFVVEDRGHLRIKCTLGAGNLDSLEWEHRHRYSIIDDLKEKRKALRISKKRLLEILRLFFLAIPELFLEERNDKGDNFRIYPQEIDNLHFLSFNQAQLNDLYVGLETEKSVYLTEWLRIL